MPRKPPPRRKASRPMLPLPRASSSFSLPCLIILVASLYAVDIQYGGRKAILETQPEDQFAAPPASSNIHLQKPSDGCGYFHGHGRPTVLQYSPPKEEDMNWLKRVRSCTTQFRDDVKFEREDIAKDMDRLKVLQCDIEINQKNFTSILSNYGTIWFFGDSILAQQFYTLLCMINPKLDVNQDMSDYLMNEPANYNARIHAEYHYRSTEMNKTTNLRYSRFGWKWDSAELNLYNISFPAAVQTLSKKDAIVMAASSHYDSTRITLMERALIHIREQARLAKAPVFYMGPSTEEWPTSNGLYSNGCTWLCECQELVFPDQLEGRWNHSHATSHVEKDSHRPPPPLDVIERYNLITNSTPFLHPYYHHTSFDCFPDCLPADWRVRVAHSIFNSANSEVSVVPVWWQLALHKGKPSYTWHADCTHKNFEGIILINQQLARIMAKRQVHDISSSK